MWTILAKALSLVLIVGIGFGMKRLRWRLVTLGRAKTMLREARALLAEAEVL